MERKNFELKSENSKLERKIREPTGGGPVDYDEPIRKIKNAISTGLLTGGILSIVAYASAYTACYSTPSDVCEVYNDSLLLQLAIPSMVGILTGLGFGYSAYNDKGDGGGFF